MCLVDVAKVMISEAYTLVEREQTYTNTQINTQ